MEPIKKIEITHGKATAVVFYYQEGALDIVYYFQMFGKPWRDVVSVTFNAARSYRPGPLEFLELVFNKKIRFPTLDDNTVDQSALDDHKTFIRDHGPAILDQARELGLLKQ